MSLNPKSRMTCDEDAERLFKAAKDKDPFPTIPPALLNSADIHDYIEATGMVYPYISSNLKSSSYEAQIGDEAFFWNDRGLQQNISLKKGYIELEPNSLVFFKTKQKFRLPSYIAIRFNLKITNVHRGLLLGTGPLVDPGFEGHLLVPIHNLTNNPYVFKGDEGFMWVEFTKISHNPRWKSDNKKSTPRYGVYEPFPPEKTNLEPWQYFQKANKYLPIRNAIPEALDRSKKLAEEAVRVTTTTRNTISIVAVIVLLGGIFGFGTLINDSLGLSQTTSTMVTDFQAANQARNDVESAAINELEGNIARLDKRVKHLEQNPGFFDELDHIHEQMRNIRSDLDKFRKSISGQPQ